MTPGQLLDAIDDMMRSECPSWRATLNLQDEHVQFQFSTYVNEQRFECSVRFLRSYLQSIRLSPRDIARDTLRQISPELEAARDRANRQLAYDRHLATKG